MRWVGGAAEELHNLDRVGRRDSDINASISPQEPNQFPDGGRADILQVKPWLCMVDTLQDILYIFLLSHNFGPCPCKHLTGQTGANCNVCMTNTLLYQVSHDVLLVKIELVVFRG